MTSGSGEQSIYDSPRHGSKNWSYLNCPYLSCNEDFSDLYLILISLIVYFDFYVDKFKKLLKVKIDVEFVFRQEPCLVLFTVFWYFDRQHAASIYALSVTCVLTNIRSTKVLHHASCIMHHASSFMHHASCIIHCR